MSIVVVFSLAATVGVTGASAPPAVVPTETMTADVVIAGGSTAALATAFAAAEQGVTTILVEPTDWIGGQFTSSGVPAVDEAWHKISDRSTGRVRLDVSQIARDRRNMTPGLRDILESIGNPGRGWVSRFCFEPKTILRGHFEPWKRRLSDRLVVLHDTVVKQVETDGRQVTALTVIQRKPNSLPHNGYDRLPSVDLRDWYSPDRSSRFEKRVLRLSGTVFVEATEWGEVLALSGADYLQGTDDGAIASPEFGGCDTCGQSIVFGFVQRLHDRPTRDTASNADAEALGFGKYEGRADAWQKIWTYRRIRGERGAPTAGDLSLQNWGYEPALKNGGNDYPFGYLFLSKTQAMTTRGDWQGGIDLTVMHAAEQRALAWHHWFQSAAPPTIGADRITLATEVLGTGHGLCKLPYIRDTRRAIGLDDFVLSLDDLVATANAGASNAADSGRKTGRRFHDRVALGAYPADVHFLTTCQYPKRVVEHRDTLPFYIPARALTHRDFDNLLVAGKTMAQTFMANSATRLHPIEWNSGTAAGVIAAWMSRHKRTSRQAYVAIDEIRTDIQKTTPTDWTMN